MDKLESSPGLEASIEKINQSRPEESISSIRENHNCDMLENLLDRHQEGKLPLILFLSPDAIKDAIEKSDIFCTWTFRNGIVQVIESNFTSSYSKIVTDLTTRIGSKPAEKEVSMQNGYGATWQNRTAVWTTPVDFIRLKENNDPTSSGLNLLVESRTQYDAEVKAIAVKPSPLD